MKVFYKNDKTQRQLGFENSGGKLTATMYVQEEIKQDAKTKIVEKVAFSKTWEIAELYKLRTNSNNFTVKVYFNDTAFTKVIRIMPSRENMKEYCKNMIVSENGGQSKGIAFSVFFNGPVDCCVVVNNFTVKQSAGIELVKSDNPDRSAFQYYPNFLNNMKRFKAKQELLAKLDCNDSLCGNEAQVDILTKIVKALVELNPDRTIREKVPELDAFFEAVDSTSVLTLKTTTKAIQDMKKQKENIRHAQQEYFQNK